MSFSDFINNNSSGIFTILGALIGASASIVGQFIFTKKSKEENLRKQRSETFEQLSALSAKSYGIIKALSLNSRMSYGSLGKRDLTEEIEDLHSLTNDFDKLKISKSILLPYRVELASSDYITVVYGCMLDIHNSKRITKTPNLRSEKTIATLELSQDWDSKVSILEKKYKKLDLVLKQAYEGKVK